MLQNFRPPCYCKTDVCPPEDTCTNNCPFTDMVSQPVMGSGYPNGSIYINNTDSQHDVAKVFPDPLPKVLNTCNTPGNDCVLNTQTATQVAYHTGSELDVWRLHFNTSFMDTGFYPVSAFELKTKMSSRQRIYSSAGVANVSFDDVDGQGVRCGEINQASIDWALANAGESITHKF